MPVFQDLKAGKKRNSFVVLSEENIERVPLIRMIPTIYVDKCIE